MSPRISWLTGSIAMAVVFFFTPLSAVESAKADLPPAGPELPADFIPYGAMHISTIPHWQHYLPPIDAWLASLEKDLLKMKEVGFNSLAVHVDWYDIETAPGTFDFRRLDGLMDLVEKHGLRILLWPWPELQPEWVPQVHPGSEWLAADDYRPGPACWDHPEVRARVERFVNTVVSRYKDRPSVLGWDLGAEAAIWVTSMGPIDQAPNARLYCYCSHTVNRYREWLKNKYSRIETLNETWATYHRDWSQVQPVRMGVFERAQVIWQDWRQFMLWNTAEFQRIKADAARKADPRHPITAHIGGWGWGYVHNSTDEYQIARHFDIFGLSFFPFWLERGFGSYDPSLGAINLDGIRSASEGKPMWIEELQGGPSIFGLSYRSRFPTPEDIRLWVWQSVAHGATGIFYWNWRPETTGIEASGFGLVNYDGSLTDRARAAGQVCQDLQHHARRLLESKPIPAEVAILHDPRTFIQAHGEQDVGLYAASVRGCYRAFWRANIPVDIIVPQQLMTLDPGRYKAIYLPFAYMLSRDEGARLARYVENGGALFAGTWCGLKDERTFLYETVPGTGLDQVFYCREIQTNPAGQSPLTIIKAHLALPSLPVGTELPVHRYRQLLEPLPGAEIVAEFNDKTPAIIMGRHGKGITLYAGTMLCHAYDGTSNAAIAGLILDFARSSGVHEPILIHKEPSNSLVEARVLSDGKAHKLIVLLNHGSAEATITATTTDNPSSTIRNLITGETLKTAADPNGIKMNLIIPAQDVRVLSVE